MKNMDNENIFFTPALSVTRRLGGRGRPSGKVDDKFEARRDAVAGPHTPVEHRNLSCLRSCKKNLQKTQKAG